MSGACLTQLRYKHISGCIIIMLLELFNIQIKYKKTPEKIIW